MMRKRQYPASRVTQNMLILMNKMANGSIELSLALCGDSRPFGPGLAYQDETYDHEGE